MNKSGEITDHIDSIIGLLRPDTSSAEHYLYDAWGRRRNPTDWSYDSGPTPTLIDRSFTGYIRETRFLGASTNRKPHVERIPASESVGKHIDKFGFINMLSEANRNEVELGGAKSREPAEAGNGRMYDPYIGRFLSVDPIIQFTGNSQSFNGYGYCLNNPLKYSDPSGYLMSSDFDNSLFDMSSYVTRNMPDFGLVYLPWSWDDSGGGGGDPFDAMNSCLSPEHPYGGYWSNESGIYYYGSDDEAFIAGCAYTEINNYWGSTSAGSLEAAIYAYGFIQSMNNYTASLDGAGEAYDPDPIWAKASAVIAILLADDLTVVGGFDDAAIPFIITGAAAIAVQNYLNKTTCLYALVARNQGDYAQFKWGSKKIENIRLNKNDVWKYGITCQFIPGTNNQWRYSQPELDFYNVNFINQAEGTRTEMLILEFNRIVNYFNTYGHLPPGNRSRR
jgi:RHS repeat-associated protein